MDKCDHKERWLCCQKVMQEECRVARCRSGREPVCVCQGRAAEQSEGPQQRSPAGSGWLSDTRDSCVTGFSVTSAVPRLQHTAPACAILKQSSNGQCWQRSLITKNKVWATDFFLPPQERREGVCTETNRRHWNFNVSLQRNRSELLLFLHCVCLCLMCATYVHAHFVSSRGWLEQMSICF